jgi:hypothetical protein
MNGVTAQDDSINYQCVLVELSGVVSFGFLAGSKGLQLGLTHVLVRYDVSTDNVLYSEAAKQVLTFKVLLMDNPVKLLNE